MSLTSLTHEHTGTAFSVVWSEEFSHGVESHDNFARNFNAGIKYPNIRMSGLADFAHVRAVQKPTDNPEDNREVIEIGLRTGQTPLSHREGNAAFARSIAEVLIVTMHAAHTWKLFRDDIAQITLPTLSSLIREFEGNTQAFEAAWTQEALDGIYDDVTTAVATDVLELHRFIRCGELFLLCIERWI